jgi:hypothetical protein
VLAHVGLPSVYLLPLAHVHVRRGGAGPPAVAAQVAFGKALVKPGLLRVFSRARVGTTSRFHAMGPTEFTTCTPPHPVRGVDLGLHRAHHGRRRAQELRQQRGSILVAAERPALVPVLVVLAPRATARGAAGGAARVAPQHAVERGVQLGSVVVAFLLHLIWLSFGGLYRVCVVFDVVLRVAREEQARKQKKNLREEKFGKKQKSLGAADSNLRSQNAACSAEHKNLPTRGIPGRFLSLVLIPPNRA